jgi:hypothetical protein
MREREAVAAKALLARCNIAGLSQTTFSFSLLVLLSALTLYFGSGADECSSKFAHFQVSDGGALHVCHRRVAGMRNLDLAATGFDIDRSISLPLLCKHAAARYVVCFRIVAAGAAPTLRVQEPNCN